MNNDYSAEIAVTRFGMGARDGELACASQNPRQWLIDQLKPIIFDMKNGSLNQASELLERHSVLKKIQNSKKTESNRTPKSLADNKMQSGAKEIDANGLKEYRAQSTSMIVAMEFETLDLAINSNYSFAARLLDFFSNHFSVTGQGAEMGVLAPLLEREAIAPNLVGKFSDMLLAVEQHPSMLIYLNNDKSVGPDSRLNQKAKKGLNENLGREILELHTLGVKGGYTQTDVRELSMAITGWSVYRTDERAQGFVFRQRAHQPGTRKILKKSYAQIDEKQGQFILMDLANHPATAEHLSFKLARHFVADAPPPALVKAMSMKWLDTQGDIKSVMQTLIEHPDSWQTKQQKFKSPREFVISTLRTLSSMAPLKLPKERILKSLAEMGQEPFKAGSPAGYGDVSSAWDGAEALMTRIEWANQIAAHTKATAIELLNTALGKQVTERTLNLVKRAESRQQSVVMALMSPEFQRR